METKAIENPRLYLRKNGFTRAFTSKGLGSYYENNKNGNLLLSVEDGDGCIWFETEDASYIVETEDQLNRLLKLSQTFSREEILKQFHWIKDKKYGYVEVYIKRGGCKDLNEYFKKHNL